jgi:hypothetical protein
MNKYKPTEAVKNNNLRGLSLIEKFKSNIKASKIDDELDLPAIKKLYYDLYQLEDKVDFVKKSVDGSLNKETLEFIAKGGSAALAWTRMILRQEQILKSFQKEITEQELNSEDKIASENVSIIKSLNEELQQVLYVAMQEGVDAHGDYVSEEDIRKAKENFNKQLMASRNLSNLFHIASTETFTVNESYIAPTDMSLNGHFVKKGTWLVNLEIHDENLWQLVKDGEVVGVSIGGMAQVHEVTE